MASPIGEAVIRVTGETSGFEKSMQGLVSKIGGFGKLAAVGFTGAFSAAVAIGGGLYKIGDQFDEAYDKIRVGTGKTGAELAGLEDTFKKVVSDVPVSFGQASDAITGLSQRLGLTGQPLQAMSEQVLQLSKITGTDVATNVESVTRLFGDWGVSGDQMAGKLDEVFRASQATGSSVEQISDRMVKFGGPMRQLGFSFEETAALMGKFEKEGVNTELVMGSMRLALGKMAKAGETDVPAALHKSIQAIKDAGSAGEANGLALKLFGARAGPDMAAAIREGRFSIDDLMATIKNGSDTINDAEKDTRDFAETWKLVKNNVFVALEPLAKRVFSAVGDGLVGLVNALHGEGVTSDGFTGAMERIGVKAREVFDWFQANWPQIKETIGEVFDRIKDAVETKVIPALRDMYDRFKEIFGFLLDHQEVLAAFGVAVSLLGVKSIAQDLIPALKAWRDAQTAVAVLMGITNIELYIVIAAVAAFVGAWLYAYKHVKIFHDAVDAYVRFLREQLLPALQVAAQWVGEHFVAAVKAAASWVRGTLIPALQAAWGWFSENILPTLRTVAIWLGTHIPAAISAVTSWIRDSLIPALQEAWSWIDTNVVPVLTTMAGILADRIVPAVRDAANWVRDHLIPALQDLKAEFDKDVGPALQAAGDSLGTIRDAFRDIGSFINEHVLPAVQALADLFNTTLTPSGMTVGETLTTLGTIFATVGAVIVGSMVAAVLRVVELFFQLIEGGSTLAGILMGAVVAAIQAVAQWFQFLWDAGQPLRDFLGNVLAGAVDALGWAFDHVRGAIDGVIGGLEALKNFDYGSITSKIPGVGVVSGIAGAINPFGAKGGIIPATAGGFPLVAGEAGSDEFLLTTDPSQRSRTVGLLSAFLHRTGYGRDLMMGLGGPAGPPLRPAGGGLQQVNNTRTWQSGAVQINIPAQGSPQATAMAVSRRLAMQVAA